LSLLPQRLGFRERRAKIDSGIFHQLPVTEDGCDAVDPRTHSQAGQRFESFRRRCRHAARFAGGSAGVLQGTRTFVLQDEDGNIELTHSISAGLDYAAVGPEHAFLRASGRSEYAHVGDEEALDAFQTLARLEGILPALESAHAVAYAMRVAKELGPKATVLVNLSGRGDKDVQTVEKKLAGRLA